MGKKIRTSNKKAAREEMAALKSKNEASVKEILRLHEVIRQVKENSRIAVEQITAMCEAVIVAAMDGKDEITVYPHHMETDKVLACVDTKDGGIVYKLVDPSALDEV